MYKVFGIIGDPVSHSLSPVMHNAAFRELGIKAVYGAFLVKSENLAQAVQGLKALNISGISVTIPHKEAILPLLDEVDETALEIGAVNTVVNYEGYLKGFNTDWIGVLKAFEEKGINLKGKKIVILGAGGASRAIIYAVKKAGAKEILLYNRTFHKAEKLAQYFGIIAYPWDKINQAEGDIIIQATSVGLKSHISPIPEEIIKRFKVAMDIVYLPLKTKFLSLAEGYALTIDGLRMLLYQGVEQFKLFTGMEAPVKIMEKVLYEEAKKLERGISLGEKNSSTP
ncbi:MAG: shikimate dehydrogenase [Caldimicrobium sp.]